MRVVAHCRTKPYANVASSFPYVFFSIRPRPMELFEQSGCTLFSRRRLAPRPCAAVFGFSEQFLRTSSTLLSSFFEQSGCTLFPAAVVRQDRVIVCSRLWLALSTFRVCQCIHCVRSRRCRRASARAVSCCTVATAPLGTRLRAANTISTAATFAAYACLATSRKPSMS